MHDLGFEHFPDHIPLLVSKYYRHYSRKFARKANRIVAVSEATKHDIVDLYKVEGDKIDVVYNAPGKQFQPLSKPEANAVQDRFTRGSEFFLYVGSIHPRKNVSRLIKAFELFKANSTCREVCLAE